MNEVSEMVLPGRLLTVADISTALQVSERAVRRWIADGSLPVVRLGRAVRIRPADLARIAATGLPAGEAEGGLEIQSKTRQSNNS